MLADNPFITIVASDKDKIEGRINEKVELQLHLNEIINRNGIVLLKGDPGIGKSTLVNWVLADLRKRKNLEIVKEEFTPSVYNKLRNISIIPNKQILVILDDFNNLELLDARSQDKVLNLVIDLSKKLGLLLVENRKTGVENALKAHGAVMEKFELKGLNKTDLRAVITDRLNLIRKVPTEDLEPFTEEEFAEIYKKTGGNVRVTLLICARLYDQRESPMI